MKVTRKRGLVIGQVVGFMYNGQDRFGEIVDIDRKNGNIILKHDVPDRHDGREFSAYKLSRIKGRVRLISTQKS